MHYHTKTALALLAATWIPSAFGCVYFNATLTQGPKQATSAQDAIDVNKNQQNGQNIGDTRLTAYLWDDRNNDNVVDALKDNYCEGIDLKPYSPNLWSVPCTPKSNQVELDVNWNPDITDGGVLVNVYKYKNPRAQAVNGNDPDKDLVFTFQAEGKNEDGDYFETTVFCDDCKDSNGVSVKC
ncbi:hypothetical protein DOTSEDRAFT_68988 [Dothistroma septosporum NZE10]|uniref:Uncharacterized protein n=1 Tax=Dothistroma septosporum (strain NZE10 / CBS 128990) TaxID=675120 RepID=N1Q4K6_DOTSN|nr:hypothetical protein DOTSEDRAFT_68988 [Dothistroma septosporum NZE10]